MSETTPGETERRLWEVRRNRHPNTDGTSWGWIEGDPERRCWSNHYGSTFTFDDAVRVAREHNAALLARCEGDR